MIFGLLAGGLLKSSRAGPDKARMLILCGVIGIVLGVALHALGICPIVKRIWTPSWTVFSGGWVTLFLAGHYYLIDVINPTGSRRWAFPFIVVGMNSIAMYVLVHIATDYLTRSFVVHFGRAPFDLFGSTFAPILLGASTLLVFWLILFWMYRKRLFLKI